MGLGPGQLLQEVCGAALPSCKLRCLCCTSRTHAALQSRRELDYRTELGNARTFKRLFSHMREIYVGLCPLC